MWGVSGPLLGHRKRNNPKPAFRSSADYGASSQHQHLHTSASTNSITGTSPVSASSTTGRPDDEVQSAFEQALRTENRCKLDGGEPDRLPTTANPTSLQGQGTFKFGSLVLGLRAEEVAEWQRFPYLLSGYRSGGTYWECVASLFFLHNELVNAWTMILSFVINTWLFSAALNSVRPRGLDLLPFVVGWVGQALHAPFSTGYHLFMCRGPDTANAWRKADLLMILFLNVCATFSLSYFTLGMRATLIWTALDTLLASYGARNILRLQPKQKLDRRGIVGVIGLTNLGYYIPMAYRAVCALAMGGSFWPMPAITAIVLSCHVAGAYIYAVHFPQSHFPNTFDLIGFSHNVMHVLAFTAYNFIFYYLACLMEDRGSWKQLWH